ncbi:MAG: CoF synthetase [Flavobacteriaceae bacterium]|nr:CoF synthetase [Flavobacteriaceae bacterium]
MILTLQAVHSFATTYRLGRPSMGRAKFERLQARALKRWLTRSAPKASAFTGASDRLSEFPVMDKAKLMSDFPSYNTLGITAEQVRTAMTHNFRVGTLNVGASTGTSGNRGFFVISNAERFRWLGSILAKAIPDILWQNQRVAIILPQTTNLYDSANSFRQIQLQFFDLTEGPVIWQSRLEAFNPTVIVAPPKILRHIAEQKFQLQPVRIFSTAETLDSIDSSAIMAAFGTQLEQIYMATEGLLGVTCRHGILHLAEDSVYFEFECVGDGLVSPIISTFRRDMQILLRYKMNDLLRLAPEPCSCGSPLQAVTEIAGRIDDCFYLSNCVERGLITPDILRNTVLLADTRITDFRLVQTGMSEITLTLPHSVPFAAGLAAKNDLHRLLTNRDLHAVITLVHQPLHLDLTRKLRRVERRWDPSGKRE